MFFFLGTEASLAEYLMKNMKSRDGEQLLNNIASAQNFQMSKDTVMSFSERYLALDLCMHQ